MAEITDLVVIDDNNTGRWPENMPFSGVNNAGRADEGLLARWFRDTNGSVTASGGSNAYAITSNRTIGSLADNTIMWFRANHTITGAATLNLNGLGARDIIRVTGSALTTGDITSGQIVGVYFSSAVNAWILLTQTGQGTASEGATGLIELATAAEVEALDSARAVRASTMHRHPGHPKAWGRVNSDGTLVAGSYNVTSSVRNSTGLYTVTLSTAMANGLYAVIGSAMFAGQSPNSERMFHAANLTTTTFTVGIASGDGVNRDAAFAFSVLGDM